MAPDSALNCLPAELHQLASTAKLLLVGAGGIGCEVLKNLVLSGFQDITVIDLDTIDVSNLNRQFLFQRQHVGKPKSVIAMQSALEFNPNAKIKAVHDSIMNPEYNSKFFGGFNLVINALDNRAARSHVNRMCLAAKVPLIESGTAGYLGQVTVIKKGVVECYDCQPKAAQKSFPGCTIRNTPSEPIHCIVWAKHLFNQLFGESDPDQDVSPDTADPEAVGNSGEAALSGDGNISRVNTRLWASSCNYNPAKLFNKFFNDDIKYLLSMDKLWQKRRPPTPLEWAELPDNGVANSQNAGIKDQRVWSVKECGAVMASSCEELYGKLKEVSDGTLVWDKDDQAAMDFVTACANIRAYIFGIPQKSRFDVKSMAGNIIPAIATTNAIIAGLMVFEAYKLLKNRIEDCRHIYLNRQPNYLKKLIAPSQLDPPHPKCFVCAEQPEVTVVLNTKSFTVKQLEEKILKGALNMVAPDVMIDNGKGTVLLSSEEGETDDNLPKNLSEFGISDGTRLKCDDFLQEYNLNIVFVHEEKMAEGVEYEIVTDLEQLKPKPVAEQKQPEEAKQGEKSAAEPEVVNMDEDLIIVEINGVQESENVERAKKRRLSTEAAAVAKKQRLSAPVAEDDAIVIE